MTEPDDLAAGAAVASLLLEAAVRGLDELREAVDGLSPDEARLAAACVACLHAGLTRGGIRHVPDDATTGALMTAADVGLVAARAAAREVPEAVAKAAAANVTWCLRSQRASLWAGRMGLN